MVEEQSFLVFRIITVLVCLLQIVLIWSNRKKGLSILGLTFCFCAIFFTVFKPIQVVKNKVPLEKKRVSDLYSGAFAYPVGKKSEIPSIIKLSQYFGEALQDVLSAKHQDTTFILDAYDGVAKEYKPFIQELFEKSTVTNTDIKPKLGRICYLTHPLFNYASPVCYQRKYKTALKAGKDTLNRIENSDLSTIAIRKFKKHTVVLVTHKFESNLSLEEQCLKYLSQNQGCLVSGYFPELTTFLLELESHDEKQDKIIRAFDINPLTDSLKKNSRFTLARSAMQELTDESKKIALIETEANVRESVERIRRSSRTYHFSRVVIPNFNDNFTKARFRSWLTQLKYIPAWLTTIEAMERRFQDIESLGHSYDSSQNLLYLYSKFSINEFSLSLLLPTVISQRKLEEFTWQGIGSWKVFRTSSNSFRFVGKQLSGASQFTLFNLKDFKINDLKESVYDYMRQKDFWLSMVIAIFLSIGISCIVALFRFHSPSCNGFYASIVFVVATTSFIWFIVSFQTTPQMRNNLSSTISLSDTSKTTYFWDSWRSFWYPEKKVAVISTVGKQKSTLNMNKIYADAKEYADGEMKKGATRQVRVVLSQDTSPDLKAGKKRFGILDLVKARNWYFRKSVGYKLHFNQWKEIMHQGDYSWKVISGSDLERDLNEIDHLIIPEIAFLSKEQGVFIEQWLTKEHYVIAGHNLDSKNVPIKNSQIDFSDGVLSYLPNLLRVKKKVKDNHKQIINPILEEHVIGAYHSYPSHVEGAPWLGRAEGKNILLNSLDLVSKRNLEMVQYVLLSLSGGTVGIQKLVAQKPLLLLEPYGVSMEELDLVIKNLNDYGIDFIFLLDEVSLSTMGSSLELYLKEKGLLFPYKVHSVHSKFVASHMQKKLLNGNAVFMTHRDFKSKKHLGPLSYVVKSHRFSLKRSWPRQFIDWKKRLNLEPISAMIFNGKDISQGGAKLLEALKNNLHSFQTWEELQKVLPQVYRRKNIKKKKVYKPTDNLLKWELL